MSTQELIEGRQRQKEKDQQRQVRVSIDLQAKGRHDKPRIVRLMIGLTGGS